MKCRVKFFAFYPDDFLEDERVITLSPRYKQMWLMLLVRMFRYKGRITNSPDMVAELLSIKKNEALAFIKELTARRLLVEDYQQLVSPRLEKEYQIAEAKYTQRSEAGKQSAARRYAKVIDFPASDSNDRYNDRDAE